MADPLLGAGTRLPGQNSSSINTGSLCDAPIKPFVSVRVGNFHQWVDGVKDIFDELLDGARRRLVAVVMIERLGLEEPFSLVLEIVE
jgi:hypothetical protein